MKLKSVKIKDGLFFPEDFKKLPKKCYIVIRDGSLIYQKKR